MSRARVALVTCAELPELDPDDRLVVEPLRALGIDVVPAVWDDPAVDWAAVDLAVLRSPWDYARRRDEFVAWAESVPRLLNPAAVIRWNTDKRYLRALAASGAPVVETAWLEPGDQVDLPAGEYVVKPAVSAGSIDTGRYRAADPEHAALAAVHVARLLDAGRTVMVQPYLSDVDTAGETALLYLGGRYSHAIRKGPMLAGPDAGVDALYKEEEITARAPSDAELAVGDAVLAAVPGGASQLCYARVDLVPGSDGTPVLLELELTEPSLFLAHGAGAPDRLAAAIAEALPC